MKHGQKLAKEFKSYTISEKLQRLAERHCPDDPQGWLNKLATQPQMLIPNQPVHNLTTSNKGQIEPNTFMLQIKVTKNTWSDEIKQCHDHCPWLERKTNNSPYCKLFKSPLGFKKFDTTKTPFLSDKCHDALEFLLRPSRGN